jgi:tetratricopeptide (TPR) repeat protein
VADGYHLWSERFDRVMEDVFAIQDEISLAIVDKLKVDLLGTEKAALVNRHTEKVEAYRLYLKGRYFWNRRTEKALEKAVSYFERAVAVDPRYALAHVGIADYYIMLGVWDFIPAMEASARVGTAAKKALEMLGRLRTLSKERYVSLFSSALIHAGLGEKDQALDELEHARQEGEPFMVHARVTPMLDSLRSDPRFTALMSKVRART